MTREERAWEAFAKEMPRCGSLGLDVGIMIVNAMLAFANAEAAAMRERAAEWMGQQDDIEGYWSLSQCIRALPTTGDE